MKLHICFLSLLLLCAMTACGPAESGDTPSNVTTNSPDSGAPTVQVTPDASPNASTAPEPSAPAVETPSPAPAAPLEPPAQSPQPAQPSQSVQPSQPVEQPEGDPPEDRDPVMAAYVSALEGLYYGHVYPNGDELPLSDFGENDLSMNQFAIYDVDGDGEDELLFQFTTAISAGMRLTVYRYDHESPGSLMAELYEYPDVTFYDNGVVKAGMSHNHSYGEDLWPYFLYSYAPVSDTYEYVASVESWDKDIRPDDFPDEADADGDGTIYLWYLGTDPKVLDGPAYQEWIDNWLDGGQELDIPYQAFTPENIAALQ